MAPPLALVVDDDFLVRMNTAGVLEEAGFEVLEAGDAASALAAVQELKRIQLVCTDVEMPGQVDGVDLALHIRAYYQHIKIIIVSGNGRSSARASGIPFLAQPFCAGSLVSLAREQLGIADQRCRTAGLTRSTKVDKL